MSLPTEQNTIITGAGSGIGRATALAFAGTGQSLVLAGRRMELLESVATECREQGATVYTHSVDLEDGDAAAAFGRWALETLGVVDVLVNNAGHSSRVRALSHVEPEEFASVFRINVEGIYRLTQSLLGSMVERQRGTVITVSSMAALVPGLLGGVPYGAAKAASLNMMQGLSAELRNQGVRACTIIPSEVNTPILDNRPKPPDQQARDNMMQAEDVAAAILLCASMPGRTLVEQIVMSPTRTRDLADELAAAAEGQTNHKHFTE